MEAGPLIISQATPDTAAKNEMSSHFISNLPLVTIMLIFIEIPCCPVETEHLLHFRLSGS